MHSGCGAQVRVEQRRGGEARRQGHSWTREREAEGGGVSAGHRFLITVYIERRARRASEMCTDRRHASGGVRRTPICWGAHATHRQTPRRHKKSVSCGHLPMRRTHPCTSAVLTDAVCTRLRKNRRPHGRPRPRRLALRGALLRPLYHEGRCRGAAARAERLVMHSGCESEALGSSGEAEMAREADVMHSGCGAQVRVEQRRGRDGGRRRCLEAGPCVDAGASGREAGEGRRRRGCPQDTDLS